MKSLLALMRKEYREAIRTGRIMIIVITASLCIICVAVSIPILNKRQL